MLFASSCSEKDYQIMDERLCIYCGKRYDRRQYQSDYGFVFCPICESKLTNRQKNNKFIQWANAKLSMSPDRSIALGQQIDDPWPDGFLVEDPLR